MSTDEHAVDAQRLPQPRWPLPVAPLRQTRGGGGEPTHVRCADPAWTYRALTVLDVFLHVFVASTFVIGIWRASYELFVLYHKEVNPWLATGAAIAVQLVRILNL